MNRRTRPPRTVREAPVITEEERQRRLARLLARTALRVPGVRVRPQHDQQEKKR